VSRNARYDSDHGVCCRVVFGKLVSMPWMRVLTIASEASMLVEGLETKYSPLYFILSMLQCVRDRSAIRQVEMGGFVGFRLSHVCVDSMSERQEIYKKERT